MAINRVAAQTMIREIPAKLRNAARAERKAIINESKMDPVGTSIKAAHGQFDFVNNIKLQKKIAKINEKFASEQYAKTDNFIQRQPSGLMPSKTAPEVVKASTYLGN